MFPSVSTSVDRLILKIIKIKYNVLRFFIVRTGLYFLKQNIVFGNGNFSKQRWRLQLPISPIVTPQLPNSATLKGLTLL